MDPDEASFDRLYKAHPHNAPGPFYVVEDSCITCEAPESEAPDLMSHDAPDYPHNSHCYFKKQPETPAELDRAIMAVRVSCCGAVRYAGNNPNVLVRLAGSPSSPECASKCDALVAPSLADRHSPPDPTVLLLGSTARPLQPEIDQILRTSAARSARRLAMNDPLWDAELDG